MTLGSSPDARHSAIGVTIGRALMAVGPLDGLFSVQFATTRIMVTPLTTLPLSSTVVARLK